MTDLEMTEMIKSLIALKTEGDYWDFKREWHGNNADLLHDIICMSNNQNNRDSYIIIGVENSTWNIVGVPSNGRKSQQNVIDFLKDKKFSGGIRPTIYVQTINIDEKVVDVLIVKNTNKTPYYLTEDYQGVFKANIYTRIRDVNTSKTMTADIDKVEYLWRKRFGLDKSALERLSMYLEEPTEWKYADIAPEFFNDERVNFEIRHHKTYPDFQLELTDVCENISEDMEINYYPPLVGSRFPDKHIGFRQVEIKYHSTVLYRDLLLLFDGGRYTIPFPSRIGIKEELECWFINLETITGKMYRFLDAENINGKFPKNIHFLEFDNKDDLECFKRFAEGKLQAFLDEYNHVLKSRELATDKYDEYRSNCGSIGSQIKSQYLYNWYKTGNKPDICESIEYSIQGISVTHFSYLPNP